MPDSILDGQGATLLMAIVIVAVALAALAGVFWIIRARASSTFIRGGKNRQPRLAVLDATAIDTRRRLVLIRRDDVEHLIMIGGPTDIVIESRIAPDPGQRPGAAAAARPVLAATERPAPHAAQPAPAEPRPQPRRAEAEPAAAARQTPPPPSPLAAPPAPAARPAMAAAAAAPATIPADAFGVLESARARVFEEPSFDEAAFDELTSPPARRPEPAPRPAQSAPPAPPATSAATSAARPATFAPATSAPSPAPAPSPARHAVAGDFESVLAAELSDDFTLDDGYFSPLEDGPQTAKPDTAAPEPERRHEAPEVTADGQPSRDSLEAEMERLLGDLSRSKP
ncbi:flagellar biosynthetic protein FliO [Hoeflea olei]|uniref:Flagellar biosynthesis protein FliO n=1 Tax=Hoeflea olei TaxID=1480615 RepID=A0A1C1YZC8_9HYPH|nr:flagellar biosynthetic protein FliO [Hoeflea olei]OCW58766.1 hypothetical protein AWJ14_00630 [Hoeflea olei]